MKRLSLLIALVAILSRSLFAAVDEPARLMPPSAAVYLQLSAVGEVVDRLLDPQLQGMLQKSSGYKTYLESPDYQKLQLGVTLLEGKLGRKWQQIVQDLSGGVYFSFDPASKTALLMVRAARPATLNELNDTIRQFIELESTNNGRTSPVQSKEYQGFRGWTFGKHVFHVIVDDLLIVSNEPAALQAVIDRYRDSTDGGLAGTDDFKQVRKQVSRGEIGWGFARLDEARQRPGLRKVLDEKSNNPLVELVLGGVFDALKGAPLAMISAHRDGDEARLRVAMPYDASKVTPARKWYFGAEPALASLPALNPPGAMLSLSYFRNTSELWAGKAELFDEATSAKMAQADSQLALYFGGRDFATDILGQLSPRTQLVVARQEFSADGVVPSMKLPAGALVLQMPEPDKFGTTLLLAFQKVIGLANLIGGQAGKPQLLLGSEDFSGVTITKGTYIEAADLDKKAAPAFYNFSPACARVGDRFIFGSTLKLTKDLITQLKSPAASKATGDNTRVQFDLRQAAGSLDDNREAIISQNMLKEGHTHDQAAADVGLLIELLRWVPSATVRLAAEPEQLALEVTATIVEP